MNEENNTDKPQEIAQARGSALNVLLSGVELIASERQRQIDKEGWTTEHDDKHTELELTRAAVAYCMAPFKGGKVNRKAWWPWSEEWWKPVCYKTCLIKAGALIAAEIDRINRQ